MVLTADEQIAVWRLRLREQLRGLGEDIARVQKDVAVLLESLGILEELLDQEGQEGEGP